MLFRSGRKIIYVDLDVGQGLITIPGMIAAVQASRPYGVDEGYSAPPLVYFYGHTSMNDNVECYKKQVSTLMKQIDNMHATPELAAAGMIINTCGFVTGKGYQLLVHTISATQADATE